MSITYNKLLKIFEEKGITSYTITKKDKVIGQATWVNIHEGKHIKRKVLFKSRFADRTLI